MRGVEKGRSAIAEGTSNPKAKLSEAAVREIRQLVAVGTNTQVLAERFGIARASVQRIAKRALWRHVA